MDRIDEMLKSYFNDNKQVIEDKGFSKKVVNRLPAIPDHDWIVWVSGAIGLSLTLYFGLKSDFLYLFFSYINHMPFYYIIGTIFSFPLLSIFVINSKHIKKIGLV